jgi:hypothetical protein
MGAVQIDPEDEDFLALRYENACREKEVLVIGESLDCYLCWTTPADTLARLVVVVVVGACRSAAGHISWGTMAAIPSGAAATSSRGASPLM